MRLIGLVLLAQSLLWVPLAAHAQPAAKIHRIGHIATPEFDQPDPTEQRAWPAFVDALKRLGWIEGKNFVFERRVLSGSTQTEIQQAAEMGVHLGTNTVRAVHMGIAAIPFGILEVIPATRHTSRLVRTVHDQISGVSCSPFLSVPIARFVRSTSSSWCAYSISLAV